jgi:hypothetical protein
MSVGSFSVKNQAGKQARVTIIPLGGPAGGELDNVNRWRGQVGLSPIQNEELTKQMETVQIGGANGPLFDMTGTPPDQKEPARILAAILSREDTTWFFKMMGDRAVIEEQKVAFKEFLKSVAFQSTAAAASAATAAPTTPVPEVPKTAEASSTDNTAPRWEVPPDWQKQPPGQMQVAKFAVADQGAAKAEVTVAVFPGDVGGLFANVNRWRRQIELPPLDPAGLATVTNVLDLGATKATLVDMTNDAKSSRLIAAVVPQGGRSWFFKLTGEKALVSRKRDGFVAFVKSFKPPTP